MTELEHSGTSVKSNLITGKASEQDSCPPYGRAAIGEHVRLLNVRSAPIDDKIGYLCRRVAGKRVLDVGAVEHDYQATKSGAWLHRHLSRAAASCLGIDILEDEVKRLQEDDFNIKVHNLCEAPILGEFDCIVMGELIEHIGESENLLRNAASALAADGRIMLTTPNPWYINTLFHAVRRGFFVDNTDHVAWYDPGTILTLAHRCDLELVGFAGLRGMKPRTVSGKVVGVLVSMLCKAGLFPLLDCKSIFYELKRD